MADEWLVVIRRRKGTNQVTWIIVEEGYGVV